MPVQHAKERKASSGGLRDAVGEGAGASRWGKRWAKEGEGIRGGTERRSRRIRGMECTHERRRVSKSLIR